MDNLAYAALIRNHNFYFDGIRQRQELSIKTYANKLSPDQNKRNWFLSIEFTLLYSRQLLVWHSSLWFMMYVPIISFTFFRLSSSSKHHSRHFPINISNFPPRIIYPSFFFLFSSSFFFFFNYSDRRRKLDLPYKFFCIISLFLNEIFCFTSAQLIQVCCCKITSFVRPRHLNYNAKQTTV